MKREVHRAEVSTCGQQITQDCSYTAAKVGCLEESGMMICVGEREEGPWLVKQCGQSSGNRRRVGRAENETQQY